jgi:hypothetical protein
MCAERVANCIFCDDIRAEIGNKFSLMGIYGGDIIFPLPPQSILVPKFGILAQLITDLDDVPDKITITIYIPPNRQEFLKLEMSKPPLEHEEGATKAHLRAILQCPPFSVSEEGYIETMIDTGRETIRAGRIFVRFFPPSGIPDATPPP